MSRLLLHLLLLPFVLSSTHSVVAQEHRLHVQIDELIARQSLGPVADQCDDATFVRRATLALTGTIPSRDATELFLNDRSANKREKKIAALLQSDDFPRHMAVTLELMLMERRSGSHVSTSDFRQYLEVAIRSGKSWLDIACEVLTVDSSQQNRAAAGFLLQRNVEPHLLTRDTGRIFFGMDLQCAQCHDHPLIDDYRQDDYYGLNAFFVRSTLFQPDRKKPALISEKAAGEATFKSVFTDREGNMRPRIPGGAEITTMRRQPHERYRVFPAKNVRAVPVDSRLSQLADTLREVPSEPFDRNMANRLWAHMFGRGLVHPVDLHHSANPPTHPTVLKLLATGFRQHNHDIRWLLHEIALTQTWQRSYQLPPGAVSRSPQSQSAEAVAAQAQARFRQADEYDNRYGELLEQVDAAVSAARSVVDAETAAIKRVEDAIKPRDAAQAEAAAAESKVDQTQQTLSALRETSTSVATSAKLLNDRVLTQLVGELTTLIEKQQAALPQLQSATAAAQNKLHEAQSGLEKVVAAAEPAITATIPVDRQIRALRREAYDLRLQAQSLRTAGQAAANRSEQLALATRVKQVQHAAMQVTERLAGDTDQFRTIQQQLTDAKAQLQTATKQHQLANSEFLKRKAAEQTQAACLAALQQQHKAITESITSVSQLAATLPQLTESGEVLTSLQHALNATDQRLERQRRTGQQLLRQSDAARDAMQSTQMSVQRITRQTTADSHKLQQLERSVDQLQQELSAARQRLSELSAEMSKSELNAFAAARLTALTPEQLAWSLLTATGQLERQKAATAAKLDKDKPLTAEQKKDPQQLQQRTQQIDAAARKALEATVARFAGLFGASPGQPQDQFFATVDQSLFLANGGEVRGWLAPAKGNLTDRVNQLQEANAAARELYLSILSRPPSREETAAVASYLEQSEKRVDAIREIAWGLLTSAEFRFQH